MSTAERNHQRHQFDFYQTPLPHVQAAFDLLPVSFTPSWVLDPGAGTGVWGREARRRYTAAMVHGIELRDVPCPEGFSVWHAGIDFTAIGQHAALWDLVVGNPPFNVAEQFIQQSMVMLSTGGYLLFLLRLNFLETQKRYPLWRQYRPFRIGVYVQRPSFTANGGTDATGYMACLWQKGYQGETTLRWLSTDTADCRVEGQQSLLEVLG